MKRGRLPLTALRSFEAAGRLQSITAAADELFVSAAAVSRQIRDLELQLGKPLFTRGHRSIALTDEGHSLLAVLTASFDTISEQLDQVSTSTARGALTISCEPSFAANWLGPRLSLFQQSEPDIDVTIDSDARLIDLRQGKVDIAIRHSLERDSWPRSQARHLTDVSLVAVAAPRLLDGQTIVVASDVSHFSLLHEENRENWQRWFHAAGLSVPAKPGPIFTDGALVYQAALRGDGVALVDLKQAAPALAVGDLVQLSDIVIPSGDYFIVVRDFARLSAPAAAFVDWLLEATSAPAETES